MTVLYIFVVVVVAGMFTHMIRAKERKIENDYIDSLFTIIITIHVSHCRQLSTFINCAVEILMIIIIN